MKAGNFLFNPGSRPPSRRSLRGKYLTILCASALTSVNGVNARITYMTLRLRSGQALKVKFERFVESYKERIKLYIENSSQGNRLHARVASIAILGVIAPVSIIPVFSAKEDQAFESKIVFDKTSGQIVDVAEKYATIVPGESQAQTEARIAAENAAKAVAEAAMAAKPAKTVKTATAKVYNDPANFDGIYQSAGVAYGIDWRILKAVHYVETGCSGSTSKRNPSGATGPMQFIPSTWRHYGVDGNGDGVVDITNVSDSIYAAANYLAASGGSANGYRTALWSYNPSARYFAKVMDVARSLGF